MVLISILAGLGAFLSASFFDWALIQKKFRLKPFLISLTLVFHAGAIFSALWKSDTFFLPGGWVLAGLISLPIFALLLIYSLMIALPKGTYANSHDPVKLVNTGMYALTRHPWILWYFMGLISTFLASGSKVLLAASPFWIVFGIVQVIIEDRIYFPGIFPEYVLYRNNTPMLIPNLRSFITCIKTFRLHTGLLTLITAY